MRGWRILLPLLAVVAIVGSAGLLNWMGAGTREWPAIKDPAALRREATALCRGAGGWRELQPAEYPPAMTALHPASISVSNERVYVALVPMGGGRSRFHGYYIWPDTAARADGGISKDESDKENAGF